MNILNWLFDSKKPKEKKQQTSLNFILQDDHSVDLELSISTNHNQHDIAVFLDAINSGKFITILAKIIGESEDEKIRNILSEWAIILHSRINKRKNFIYPSEVLKQED